MWKCPLCENEIEHLDYDVDSREWGSCDLSNSEEPETSNFEQSDSEWSGDVSYRCPECNEEINLSDLLPVKTEQEEEKPIKRELEEEKFNIIKPEINLQIEKNNIDQTENTMICKHCFYVFVYSTENYSNEEDFHNCPNCEEQNNKKEYKKLITDRFFEKIKIKKLCRKANYVKKKYAKKTKGRRIKPVE